jgi:hypothetical protein
MGAAEKRASAFRGLPLNEASATTLKPQREDRYAGFDRVQKSVDSF